MYKKQGGRVAAFNFVPHESFGRESKMCFADVSFDDRTKFVHERATNVKFYVENILQDHVPIALWSVYWSWFCILAGQGFVSSIRMKSISITVINWPARSSDL